MTITREEDFPAEAAQLVKAINACCEGYPLQYVEMATANMFSAVIHNGAKMRNISKENFGAYARAMLQQVLTSAVLNFDRVPQPTDVPVKDN